jgi:acyl-CoA synthetase (AMP-forming)/AMP-acid ligase II
MHPSHYARSNPDRAAIIMAESGERVTYGELDASSNRAAHLFRSLGLHAGDAIAMLFENTPKFFELSWAAQRSGLYFTPISTRLTIEEALYIVNDSGATVFVASSGAGELAQALAAARSRFANVQHFYYVGEPLPGARSWSAAVEKMPSTAIADETAGQHMVYSSGTTGRPKGVKIPLTGGPADGEYPFVPMNRQRYGFEQEMIYLSPAPLYHTAPLVTTMVTHRIGGTTVILEHFTPESALEAIQRYRITHTQMVPTMFVRMLKLPEAKRLSYDLSSLRTVVHAAAPCPIPIKHQMIEWLGPIVYEYYGGTEGNGTTSITSQEWLKKPGSVGRAVWGTLHICDDAGRELPPGQQGSVYFEGGFDFHYHNDEQKTASARHPQHWGWSTLGDVGYADADGYLFLTDRKAFMIISGGVNIYPQETENILITHPKVADVAVIGVPNDEFGEEVKAVIQPMHWEDASPAFAQELMAFCRTQLSPLKCPRSVDFERELPRHPTGKLYKRVLRDRYWANKASRIV